MGVTHFMALLPLLILFVMSIKWHKSWLIDIIPIAYAGALAYMAVDNDWELVMWPPIVGVVVVDLILLWDAAFNGDML